MGTVTALCGGDSTGAALGQTRLPPAGRRSMPGIEPDTTILRGHTLAFRADPLKVGPDAAVDFHSDGAVAMASGKIVAVGQALDVIARHPDAALETYANHLSM